MKLLLTILLCVTISVTMAVELSLIKPLIYTTDRDMYCTANSFPK